MTNGVPELTVQCTVRSRADNNSGRAPQWQRAVPAIQGWVWTGSSAVVLCCGLGASTAALIDLPTNCRSASFRRTVLAQLSRVGVHSRAPHFTVQYCTAQGSPIAAEKTRRLSTAKSLSPALAPPPNLFLRVLSQGGEQEQKNRENVTAVSRRTPCKDCVLSPRDYLTTLLGLRVANKSASSKNTRPKCSQLSWREISRFS
jgi:hypothetical protein